MLRTFWSILSRMSPSSQRSMSPQHQLFNLLQNLSFSFAFNLNQNNQTKNTSTFHVEVQKSSLICEKNKIFLIKIFVKYPKFYKNAQQHCTKIEFYARKSKTIHKVTQKVTALKMASSQLTQLMVSSNSKIHSILC